MIKLSCIGHLGKDCNVNSVNGKSVINFSVAHTEKFRDASGNQRDKTIWVECAYWTDRTAIAPYLKKGSQVYVEGNPDLRTYQTNDGRQGASLALRVSSIQLLGSNSNNQNSHPSNQQNNYTQSSSGFSASEVTEPMDDLPF